MTTLLLALQCWPLWHKILFDGLLSRWSKQKQCKQGKPFISISFKYPKPWMRRKYPFSTNLISIMAQMLTMVTVDKVVSMFAKLPVNQNPKVIQKRNVNNIWSQLIVLYLQTVRILTKCSLFKSLDGRQLCLNGLVLCSQRFFFIQRRFNELINFGLARRTSSLNSNPVDKKNSCDNIPLHCNATSYLLERCYTRNDQYLNPF